MISQTFDDYTIIEQLGIGGMGSVYLAQQNSLARNVAIKIIDTDQDTFVKKEMIERFLREAKTTASIQHPNIINIFKIGQWDDSFYIVMEYIDGIDLEKRLQESNIIDERTSWLIALQTCRGLQAALQQNIIHRDVKPGNILLAQGNIVKLTDFGLSKKIGDNSRLTQDGSILGSPLYMSPEHATGREINFYSDIYSLGTTIYYMLTGYNLFNGCIIDILYKHKSQKPISPKRYISSLSSSSEAILAKMLHKDPGNRYKSYGDVIIDINSLLNDKELVFAKNSDAISAFEYNKTGKKIRNTKKFLRNLLKPMQTKRKREQKFSVACISGLTANLSVLSNKGFPVHSIISITELKNYLKNNQAFVILDSKSLGTSCIDFLYYLKINYPQTPGLILVDIPSFQIARDMRNIFYSRQKKPKNIEDKVYSSFKKPFILKNINLQIILNLFRYCKWTTQLNITIKNNQDGIIIFNAGAIEDIKIKDMDGENLIDDLLNIDICSWQIHKPVIKIIKEETHSGMLLPENSKKFNKNLDDENEPLKNDTSTKHLEESKETVIEKDNSVECVEENDDENEPLKNDTSIKHLEESKETVIEKDNSVECVEENKNDIIENNNAVKCADVDNEIKFGNNKNSLYIEENRDTVIVNNDQNNKNIYESKESSNNKEFSFEKDGAFDNYMDQALEALLKKEYNIAWDNFQEAYKINPDNPTLKLNLNRLKEILDKKES